jgi:hypothetical protein
MSAAGWLFWIALTFAVACCLAMYLITRWTKPPRDPYAQIAADFRAQITAAETRRKMRERFEAPRPRLGADETLRRHIFSTRKAKHERARPKA